MYIIQCQHTELAVATPGEQVMGVGEPGWDTVHNGYYHTTQTLLTGSVSKQYVKIIYWNPM